jgi:hypothetical protein
MQFKVSDTLVTVVPKLTDDLAKVCLFRTRICFHPTICLNPSICFGCTWRPTFCYCSFGTFHCPGNSCGLGGSACDPTQFCAGTEPFVIQDKEDLVSLRAELQDTLKRLDAVESAGLPSAIKSKAEADALERSLTEALEQVRAAKKNLK